MALSVVRKDNRFQVKLYKMINDPLGAVMGVENVKENVKMADSELLHCA